MIDVRSRLKEIAEAGWDMGADGCGVYAIVNTASMRAYIGSSAKIKVRLSAHMSNIFRKKGPNKRLLKDADGCGVSGFASGVLVICEEMSLRDVERGVIHSLSPNERYNAQMVVKQKLPPQNRARSVRTGDKFLTLSFRCDASLHTACHTEGRGSVWVRRVLAAAIKAEEERGVSY